MAFPNLGRRIGVAVLTLGASTTVGVMTASAAHAEDPYIPPMSCGVVNHESGPLTSLVHGLEPLLRPVRLEYALHGLNCAVLINTEYLLGLQLRPQFP